MFAAAVIETSPHDTSGPHVRASIMRVSIIEYFWIAYTMAFVVSVAIDVALRR